MKKILMAAASFIALTAGAAALPTVSQAAVLNWSSTDQDAVNVDVGDRFQAGLSVDVAIGSEYYSSIESTVTNVIDVISQRVGTDQTGLFNVALADQDALNLTLGDSAQIGGSVIGTGAMNESDNVSAVTNVVDAISQNVDNLQD